MSNRKSTKLTDEGIIDISYCNNRRDPMSENPSDHYLFAIDNETIN